MTVSYAIPLLVLLGMAWLVDFAEAPIPINLLSYAPFLGFFGFNFYSWLTILDSPDFMNGLPLKVPDLIRAKVVVYFLATSWISLIFIVLMAWRLDEWASLPTSIIVMFANSVYIVALTAFLMGLRPNKAIFDASIMVWFWIGTVLPLLGLFLLSFTQGDVSLYGNWWERASQDGLAATAQMYDETMVQQGYMGMIAISIGLIPRLCFALEINGHPVGALRVLKLSLIANAGGRFLSGRRRPWTMGQVVAVCGMPGSGKGEFAAVLAEAGVPIVSMGDMIRAEVQRLGLEEAPHVFGEVAASLRAAHGEDVLAVRLCDRVDELLQRHPLVLIEGLRGTAEDAVFAARWERDVPHGGHHRRCRIALSAHPQARPLRGRRPSGV